MIRRLLPQLVLARFVKPVAIMLLLLLATSLVACTDAVVLKSVSEGTVIATPINTTIENPAANQTMATSQFEIVSLSISPARVETGQPVTIMADIKNLGNGGEYYQAELKINDKVELAKTVTIPTGSTTRVNFLLSVNEPGDYAVNVDDLTGNLAIVNPIIASDVNASSCCDSTQTIGSSGSSCCSGSTIQQNQQQSIPRRSSGSCCGN